MASASMSSLTSCEALMADLEALWTCFDQLTGSFSPADWTRKHGKDWVLADVPYHMAYFDRMIARIVDLGTDLPEPERRLYQTENELNAWNSDEFARRSITQTLERSIDEMRGSRASVRRLLNRTGETDLDRPAFMPLGGMGWTTARQAINICRVHTWSEFVQLRIHAGRSKPEAPPTATHAALDFYCRFLGVTVDRDEAARARFTTVMEFAGPGGGAWTLRVADGACTVVEERAEKPDLVMTQSPESFVRTMNGIHNPMLAMLTGRIRVRGWSRLGTFGKLFREPRPDERFGFEPGEPPAQRAA